MEQSQSNVGIRKATSSDIPSMGKLWKQLVLEELPNANPDMDKWNDIQEQLFNLTNYYAFVAVVNGKIVGFNNGLVLNDIETNSKYVDGGHFYVIPEYRGRAGRLLHRNSFDYSRELGAKFLRRKISDNNKRMKDRMLKGIGKRYFIKEYIVDEMIGALS